MFYFETLLLAVAVATAVYYFRIGRDYRRRAEELHDAQQAMQRERAAALDLVNRIGLSFGARADLDTALQTIAEYIVETTDAEAGAIFLLNAESGSLQARAVVGLFPPMHTTTDYVLTKRKYLAERIKRDRIKVGEGIIGFVAKTGQGLLIPDALADPRVPNVSTDFLQIRSIIVSPLRLQQRTLGVFAVVNKQGEAKFDDQDMHVLQQLADHAALTVDMGRLYEQRAEQLRLEQELEMAHEFQSMLLPSEPPRIPGMELAAFSQPAREVGGDYYDFFQVDDQHLGVAIVDVSGKGIPGALVMAIVRSTLRAEAIGDLSPKDVVRRVNRRVYEDTKKNVFVTMTYGLLGIRSRRFRFVRAGHEPLIAWNEQDLQPRLVTPRGIALGLGDDSMFALTEECEINLSPGDTVVLYTDGVIEAMNEANEEYGSERFLSVLQENQTGDARRQLEAVLEDINRFTGGHAQHDDITMLTLKVHEAAEQSETPRSESAEAPLNASFEKEALVSPVGP